MCREDKRDRSGRGRLRRLVTVVGVVILLCTLLLLLTVGGLCFYAYRTLDFERDELLFASAGSDSETHYMVRDSADGTWREVACDTPSTHRTWVSLAEVPPLLRDGFLAVEDRHFYRHHGFDPGRTLYAAVNRVLSLRPGFGASTVTQQVVKNISGDSEVTLRRKLNEILRACRMEQRHSKDEILELYLNIVPMGENMCGVGTAAEEYFGKSCDQLTAAEAATLIGIANAPGRYHPRRAPEACSRKRDSVLAVLRDQGVISERAYREAQQTPLQVLPTSDGGTVSSWFVETVRADVLQDLMQQRGMSESAARMLLYRGGLQIYMTEDPAVQETLEKYFAELSHFPPQVADGLEFAMAVTDTRTGALVGIVGAVGDKRGERLLNLATVPHTPGSALKPLALCAPLLDTREVSWSTVFDDVPLSFTEREDGSYALYPHNYPDRYDGLLPLGDALRLSKNTVAMRLYERQGAERIFRLLTEQMHLPLLRYEPGSGRSDLSPAPLALGQLTYGVSLRSLTAAYSTLAADGVYHRARSYTAVFDSAGQQLLGTEEEGEVVFRPQTARLMTQLLAEVVRDGTAKSLTLKNSVDTAGKTGTSGADRDRLFVGYTPYYTAGIWCGYRQGGQAVGNHTRNHLTVWDEVMGMLHDRLPDEGLRSFSTAGLERCCYCRDSGSLYAPACYADVRGDRMGEGWFEVGYAPQQLCEVHRLCRYDAIGGGVACPMCPYEDTEEIALLYLTERAFPVEVSVSDAQYVLRELPPGTPLGDRDELPFFTYAIPPYTYVGRSGTGRQYNASCPLHGSGQRQAAATSVDIFGAMCYDYPVILWDGGRRRRWNIRSYIPAGARSG